MKSFIVELQHEKAGTYRFMTLLVILINCIFFGIYLLNPANEKLKSIGKAGTIISLVSFIFILIKHYKKKLPSYKPEITLIILSLLWISAGKYLIAICMITFSIIGFYASKKLKVIFTADKILYPSFPAKTILWSEVKNVMIKDSVLTIDLKNNMLFQSVLDKKMADEIAEDSFNEFCMKQMNVIIQ